MELEAVRQPVTYRDARPIRDDPRWGLAVQVRIPQFIGLVVKVRFQAEIPSAAVAPLAYAISLHNGLIL